MAGSSSIRWTDQAHEHLCTISICWAILSYYKNDTTREQHFEQLALDWFHACRRDISAEPTSSADRMDKVRSRIWTRFEKAISRGKIETVPHFRSIVRSQLKFAYEAFATILKPRYGELISSGQLRPAKLQRILTIITDDVMPYTKRTAALETLGLAIASLRRTRHTRRQLGKPSLPVSAPIKDAPGTAPDAVTPAPSEVNVPTSAPPEVDIPTPPPSEVNVPTPVPSEVDAAPEEFTALPDCTSVNWCGTEYTFRSGHQAEAVQVLIEAHRKGLHSVSEVFIRGRLNAKEGHFRLDHLFREAPKEYHKAWRTMIRRVSRGCYGLFPPGTKESDRSLSFHKDGG